MKSVQMKSLLLSLAFLLLMGAGMEAKAQSQFSLGIKVAGNAVNYRQLTTRNFGLEAGIFMRLGRNFFFQPEVNYVFKSSTFKGAIEEISSNTALKQHFIAVPALLGYHFINNENFKFRLTAGPRFDFKIADNLEGTGWKTSNVQWGGQFGVGIDFWRFALDFSYCIAADKLTNTTSSAVQKEQMNMFILSLGFKIVK